MRNEATDLLGPSLGTLTVPYELLARSAKSLVRTLSGFGMKGLDGPGRTFMNADALGRPHC